MLAVCLTFRFYKLQAEPEKIEAGVEMRTEVGAVLVTVVAHVLVTTTVVAPDAREARQESDAAHGLGGGVPTAGHDITALTVVPSVDLVDVILTAQCMKTLTLLPIHSFGLWLLKSKAMTRNMRKLCASSKRTIQSTTLFSIEMWVILALQIASHIKPFSL